jgi:hypothetical protein
MKNWLAIKSRLVESAEKSFQSFVDGIMNYSTNCKLDKPVTVILSANGGLAVSFEPELNHVLMMDVIKCMNCSDQLHASGLINVNGNVCIIAPLDCSDAKHVVCQAYESDGPTMIVKTIHELCLPNVLSVPRMDLLIPCGNNPFTETG